MDTRLRLGSLALLLIVLVPAAASAQASIAGAVRDTSGAVLPGVTVEASSPVLIEKVRVVISDDAGQYRAIYDEFLALKVKCGESVENLTYDRFLTKLRSNRDALIAKHGCKAVKFQVYVKDGKAALKASPVR